MYLAEHRLLKRPCALKLIRPDRLADPRVLVRFEREVRMTATLSHPNTVEIYDYGRTEDGTFYYVMEYLPGLSLAELVDRYGPLPPGACCLPVAASLRGLVRGPRCRPDPSRHQNIEYLCGTAGGPRRRGQAARFRSGCAPRPRSGWRD